LSTSSSRFATAKNSGPDTWKASTPGGSSARWLGCGAAPKSSASSSSSVTSEPIATTSLIRCMNRNAASTSPTSIATVRSNTTVSAKVRISTARSPTGPVMRCRKLSISAMFHATITSTAASTASGM